MKYKFGREHSLEKNPSVDVILKSCSQRSAKMRKVCFCTLQNQSAKKPVLTVNIQLGHMRGCSFYEVIAALRP